MSRSISTSNRCCVVVLNDAILSYASNINSKHGSPSSVHLVFSIASISFPVSVIKFSKTPFWIASIPPVPLIALNCSSGNLTLLL